MDAAVKVPIGSLALYQAANGWKTFWDLSESNFSGIKSTMSDSDINISVKNRNTILLKSILTTLNGANIEGIGTLQFNQEMSEKCQAEMRLSNSKNFYGYTVVLSCHMGSLGVAENGFR